MGLAFTSWTQSQRKPDSKWGNSALGSSLRRCFGANTIQGRFHLKWMVIEFSCAAILRRDDRPPDSDKFDDLLDQVNRPFSIYILALDPDT
jgi:hypothetical protein